MGFRAVFRGIVVLSALLVSGCGEDQAHNAPPARPTISKSNSSAGAQAAAIDATDAITNLKAEKWVKIVHYRPGKFPNWVIEVKGAGSPEFGYADIACMIIRENKAEEVTTVVQLVEAGSYIEGEAPSLSLGMVNCKTGAQAN